MRTDMRTNDHFSQGLARPPTAPLESAGSSRLGRLLRSKRIRGVAAAVVSAASILAACWFFPRSLLLQTPLAVGESFAAGTAVYLDDASVGKVSGTRLIEGVAVAELRLSGLTMGEKRKLKDGVVRVAGYRMVWLTSEFIDPSGPPLIDGDTVPTITRSDRESRLFMAKFWSWALPSGGVGLLWIVWRGAKRIFA